MNYKRIYEEFIKYCKNTSPKERLYNRDKNDFRIIAKMKIYIENHHIIPRSLGGSDNKDNLVKLLPEEHLFAHKIRYKAYNKRNDMLAVRYMINGFENASDGNRKQDSYCSRTSKSIRNSYFFMRQHSYNFRKEHGWQTIEGKKRISEARKGTFPMKDVITGKIVGSFSKEHSKYISGEWVHHYRGMVAVESLITNEKMYIESIEYQNNKELYKLRMADRSGENNSRAYNISNKNMLDDYIDFCQKEGFIMKYGFFSEITKLDNSYVKSPGMTNFRMKKFYEEYGMTIEEKAIELTKLPYLNSKGYNNEIKEKYFNGKSGAKIYLYEKYGVSK